MASPASGTLVASLVLAACVAPGPLRAATGDDVLRLLSADAAGLAFELSIPEPGIEPAFGADGATYERVRVPGWAGGAVAGLPDLPARGVLIQVPPSGSVNVEVEEIAPTSRAGLLVLPVLAPAAAGDGSPTPLAAVPDERIYASSAFHPGAPFALSPRALMRGVPVMRLTLHPYRWNPATGELRFPARMTVRVRFGDAPGSASPAATAPSADPFDPVLEGAVLNWGGRRAPAATPQPGPVGISPPGVRLRMEIDKEGLYRVTGADLQAAGVSPGTVDPRTLRVLNRRREAAIRVVSASPTRFAAGDFLEFYALELNDTFTDTNVYWLLWNGNPGLRIDEIPGAPLPGGEPVAAFRDVLRFEENHRIWDTMPGAPEQDYWFWQLLQSPAAPTAPAVATHTLTIPSPGGAASDNLLRISLRGRTAGAHRALLHVNGVPVGDDSWVGSEERVGEWALPPGLLADGPNELRVELPGGTGIDQVFLNWAEVAYERAAGPAGDGLRLPLSGGGDRTVEVAGASEAAVRVLDITDPNRPRLLGGTEVSPDGGTHTVRFGVAAGAARTFTVVTDAALRTPLRLARWRPGRLRAKAGADYILITPREFLAAARPLLRLRREQGLRVRAAAVEDIYNAYGAGLPDPGAVKRFIADAYASWERPAPAYVLLLGDANTDYRGYLGPGKLNRVPVHLTPTASLALTPDDNWYAAVDGDDDLPDLYIGRISVGSAEAAAAAVDKIVGYERRPPPRRARALFVADNNDPEFQALAERLAGALPATVAPRRVYLPECSGTACQPVAEQARAEILGYLDDGMAMTTYVGHGDVRGWGGETTSLGERILETAAVPLLGNGDRLTFLAALDCLNGFFSRPFDYSLGELLVNTPGKGAVASLAPSGLGFTWEHALLGEELFDLAFAGPTPPLGRLATRAKLRAHARGATIDLVKTFTLLGDPATRLALPTP